MACELYLAKAAILKNKTHLYFPFCTLTSFPLFLYCSFSCRKLVLFLLCFMYFFTVAHLLF